MNSIPKSKLEKFGISVRCNRKRKLNQTNAARWTQINFCEGICSQTSLISIEKGNISRFIDNYPMLAERLDLKITYSPDIDKRANVYTKEIYTAIEFYDFRKMKRYFDKLYELLEPVKDCLWYCDLYNAAVAIDGYYLHRKFMNVADRMYYADMIGELSKVWDEILKSVIFISSYHDMNTSEYLFRFDDFEIEKCKSAFNKVNTMLFLYDQDRTNTLLELARIYEQEWIREKNDLRLLDLYGIILPCFSFHDAFEVQDVHDTIMDIMETHEVFDYKKAECYYVIGIAYYNLELYEITIENMLTAYSYDKEHIKPLYVYIAHAQRMMKQKIDLPYYSEEDISKHSLIYQQFYKFYSIVEKDPEAAERYIMSDIVPVINSCLDKVIFEIMQKEVEIVANTTNHYKLIVKYKEKVKMPEQLNKKKLYFRRTAEEK